MPACPFYFSSNVQYVCTGGKISLVSLNRKVFKKGGLGATLRPCITGCRLDTLLKILRTSTELLTITVTPKLQDENKYLEMHKTFFFINDFWYNVLHLITRNLCKRHHKYHLKSTKSTFSLMCIHWTLFCTVKLYFTNSSVEEQTLLKLKI